MDTGADLIKIWETTPATTVRPAFATRFPRYLNDFLLRRCDGDAEALQREEREIIASSDKARLSEVHEKRRILEQCIAKEFEQARLSAFDRKCGKECDPKKLFSEMVSTIHATLARYRFPLSHK
jgi:hypothetical protein